MTRPTHPITTPWRRRAWLMAAVMAMAAVAIGCGSDDSTGNNPTTGDPATGEATEASTVGIDYSAFGPYAVGSTITDVDGVEVQLLYPVAPDDAEPAARVDIVSSDVAFPADARELLAQVAPFFVQELPVELYTDAPVAGDGPFPVVLYSHGFGGHPAFYLNNLAHTASWGYVVAAPDHPSRNLASNLSGLLGGDAEPVERDDVGDLVATVEALDQLNADADGPFHLAIDTNQLAAAGHSAGGGATMRLAVAGDVAGRSLATVIGHAPAPPIRLAELVNPDATEAEREEALANTLATTPAPDIPVLLVAGERDGVIPLETVEATYEWLSPPRQLVVMANTGHNPVLDICAQIRDQGGLVAAAGGLVETFGESVERLLSLGEDGCVEGYTTPEDGFAVVRHLTVAQVRWAFGQDDSRVSLDAPFLRETFGAVIGPVETQQ